MMLDFLCGMPNIALWSHVIILFNLLIVDSKKDTA